MRAAQKGGSHPKSMALRWGRSFWLWQISMRPLPSGRISWQTRTSSADSRRRVPRQGSSLSPRSETANPLRFVKAGASLRWYPSYPADHASETRAQHRAAGFSLPVPWHACRFPCSAARHSSATIRASRWRHPGQLGSVKPSGYGNGKAPALPVLANGYVALAAEISGSRLRS